MQLNRGQVIAALACAKDLSEQYVLYALRPRNDKSIDTTVWLIGEYVRRKVTYNEVAVLAEGSNIRGLYMAYANGNYLVFTLSELPERERRFVACKELFHVVMDQAAFRSMDLLGLIEEAQETFFLDECRPSDSMASELLTEIAAMEYLFPYAERAKEIESAGSDGPDHSRIAAKYGVPQHMVEIYLTQKRMAAFSSLSW